MNKYYPLLAAIFLGLFPAFDSQAEIIEITTSEGRIATAEYTQGEADMAAVIIMHGFLLTREFSTVSRLSAALKDLGYTVLSPSLSLGLSRRNRSLDCEAVHTHSLHHDVNELKQWVNWLENRTGKHTYIIGHSSAGSAILSYLIKYPQAKHPKSILISLSHYASGPEASETPEHARMARQASKTAPRQIQTYALNYCKTYPSYPDAFLSYYEWDKKRTLDAIEKLGDKISIVIGSSDKRIEANWRQYLSSITSELVTIEGANHFFDQAHEFDLHDAIETILSEN